MYFNSISKLFLLSVLTGLLSCQLDDQLTGVAAGATGRYLVTAYIVSGDTLFAARPALIGYKPRINKIGVDNFTIVMDVLGSDQLLVKTDYWRNGVRSTFSKKVVVRLTNYDYQFSLLQPNVSSFYEGSVGRFTGFFYERAKGGISIPLADSSANSNPLFSPDIVIIAQLLR